MQPRPKLANLSAKELRDLASRDDTIIMQHEYETVYSDPWDESRVEHCVTLLRRIAVRAKNTDECRTEALKNDTLREFSNRYKKIFERFSNPDIARSENLTNTLLAMIQLHEKMRKGEIGEREAHAHASDLALKSVLREGGAPEPPQGEDDETTSRIFEV